MWDVVTTTTRGRGNIITRWSPLTPARAKSDAKSWQSSQTHKAIMEDNSSTHTFPSLHHHHNHPSFHLTLPSLQSPEVGYASSQPPLDVLEQFGSREEESTTSFLNLSTSSGGRRQSGGGDIDFPNMSGSGLDGDASFGGHPDGQSGLGGHFVDNWYGKKEEIWEDGESCESAVVDFYSKNSCYGNTNGVFYSRSCSSDDGSSCIIRANYNSYSSHISFGAKNEAVYNKEACRHENSCIPDSIEREDDFGSGSGSGEDQPTPAEVEPGPWLSVSPSKQATCPGEDKWRGGTDGTDTLLLASGCQHEGINGGTHTQKLDSFSDAFLSHCKRGSPVLSGGDSFGQVWEFGSLPTLHPSGLIWKFPVLSPCFPQSSGDPSGNKGNLRRSHGGHYSNITAQHNILQTSEPSFIASPSQRASIRPSRAHCPSKSPSIHPSSLHPPSHPTHLSGQHYEELEKIVPHVVSQKVKNGPKLGLLQYQQQIAPIYTGTPFATVLHSGRGQRRRHYTPQPLLNPVRRGTGLYSSLWSVNHREEGTASQEEEKEEEEECGVSASVNVGHDFQAEIPPCYAGSRVWSPEPETLREELLWKPWDELGSSNSQYQVERLLMMCSSSCLPEGGSNTELALHCLHHCKGNTMETLEMLLFSQPSPKGDYHYSGSDVWTESEKSIFGAALETYGKDFSLIQKMVRSKTVCQCVEFYYLKKKLQEKQKQKEEEARDGGMEQQKNVACISQPMNREFGLEGAVPVPSLASFFPCKLCGKMFYKIKSRNAHMKIHRQPQEDWADRRLQQQLLTQRLTLNLPTNHTPTPGRNLPPPQAPAPIFSSCGPAVTSSNNVDADHVLSSVSATNSNSIAHSDANVLHHNTRSNINTPNSHLIPTVDSGDSGVNQREPVSVIPFHQSWSSFGHNHDPTTFYCDPEVKESLGAEAGGGKEPINWQ
ncbi:hypothetical protein LDENG_00181740 [Lucifuga dentata]|nr:hypothetical protein LDENG_00181740 [Lucifuga dentata]